MTQYNFILTIEVNDPEQLFTHALNHVVQHDGLPTDEALEMLKPDGEVDTEACLIAIMDPGMSPPGTEIFGSEVLYLCKAA